MPRRRKPASEVSATRSAAAKKRWDALDTPARRIAVEPAAAAKRKTK